MVASQTSLSAHRGSSADIEPRLAELQRSASPSARGARRVDHVGRRNKRKKKTKKRKEKKAKEIKSNESSLRKLNL